jgi:hypothetical protein
MVRRMSGGQHSASRSRSRGGPADAGVLDELTRADYARDDVGNDPQLRDAGATVVPTTHDGRSRAFCDRLASSTTARSSCWLAGGFTTTATVAEPRSRPRQACGGKLAVALRTPDAAVLERAW